MNASNADQEIKHVVRDLLSRDPVQFNSTINAHFASSCTYQGRGLKISGASQVKHAAYLLNVLDFGSPAQITDQDIRWDSAGTTAIVKATRHVRPAFFPLFQFAVPTKVVLSFNAEEGAKDTLFCTQWKDEWPLEQLIQAVPLVRSFYSSLLVPLLTVVFLWASNVAFWLHSKVESVEHRYARDATKVYRQKVEPRLPPSLVKGFDAGVHAAEHVGQHGVHVISRVSHGPLRAVEELARTATVLVNLALPQQLQIPYPSVFADPPHTAPVKQQKPDAVQSTSTKKDQQKSEDKPAARSKSDKSEGDGSQSPRKKVSGSPHVDTDSHKQTTAQKDEPTVKDDLAEDHKRKAESSPTTEEPRHAKVVVGPTEDGSQPQAKEIDVVTQQVTEKPAAESARQSLYDVLKKDDQLPGGSGGKKSGGKKKGKNGGRK
ncbi:uncharacterized protein UTRI_01843_B [Ustilago trichophora]|uniref:Uncharacterized protein n=1 Tax=Ustilago trichophora TaxID=86804 RepID=A0A5C3DXC1_9BASI|nr:uncharacterized protein UTRI_01843_B [Ustilago trichophora]